MEQKLKKFGKFLSKGLKAGVLATMLINGTACQQPNGSEHKIVNTIPGGNGGHEQGGNGGQQGSGNGGFGTEIDPETYVQQDANATSTYGFTRHRFLNEGESTRYNDTRKKEVYAHAINCYGNELKNFQDAVKKDVGTGYQDNTMYKMATAMINNYNSVKNNTANNKNIMTIIQSNYDDLAKPFARIENEQEDGKYFFGDYQILALRAYNDSLGTLKNDYSMDSFTEINGSQQKLKDIQTYERNVYDMLEAPAQFYGVKQDTMVKLVNLALLTEGIYGYRDTTYGISSNYRTNDTFLDQICANCFQIAEKNNNIDLEMGN